MLTLCLNDFPLFGCHHHTFLVEAKLGLNFYVNKYWCIFPGDNSYEEHFDCRPLTQLMATGSGSTKVHYWASPMLSFQKTLLKENICPCSGLSNNNFFEKIQRINAWLCSIKGKLSEMMIFLCQCETLEIDLVYSSKCYSSVLRAPTWSISGAVCVQNTWRNWNRECWNCENVA